MITYYNIPQKETKILKLTFTTHKQHESIIQSYIIMIEGK